MNNTTRFGFPGIVFLVAIFISVILCAVVWVKLSKKKKRKIKEAYFRWVGYFDELSFYNLSLALLLMAFHYRNHLIFLASQILQKFASLIVKFTVPELLAWLLFFFTVGPFLLFLIFCVYKSFRYAFYRHSFYHNAKGWEKLALLFFALLLSYGIAIPAGLSAFAYLSYSKETTLNIILLLLFPLYSGLKGLVILSSLRIMKEEHILKLLKPYNARPVDILVCTLTMLVSYVFLITKAPLPMGFYLVGLYKIGVALGVTQMVEAYLKHLNKGS